jgi:hypothetical protein
MRLQERVLHVGANVATYGELNSDNAGFDAGEIRDLLAICVKGKSFIQNRWAQCPREILDGWDAGRVDELMVAAAAARNHTFHSFDSDDSLKSTTNVANHKLAKARMSDSFLAAVNDHLNLMTKCCGALFDPILQKRDLMLKHAISVAQALSKVKRLAERLESSRVVL